MGGYHIAVVGATGAAGTELLRVLERRNFPVASLRPIGSARSVGKSGRFCGDSIPVEKLEGKSFEKIDIAFFSAGGDVSRTTSRSRARPMPPRSTVFRFPNGSARAAGHSRDQRRDVGLHRGVIANPNCTTTVMLMARYPLHKLFPYIGFSPQPIKPSQVAAREGLKS